MSGDGFEVRSGPATRGVTFRVHRWSAELEAALSAHDVEGVLVEPFWEGASETLEAIVKLAPQIRRLSLPEKVTATGFVARLRHLEELSCGCIDEIDFAQLPALEVCLVEGASSLANLRHAIHLRDLSLMGARVGDLSEIQALPGLRSLHLSELRRLTSLQGIGSLPLGHLQLVHLPSLVDIEPIASLTRLQSLEIDGCRRISSLAPLEGLRQLRALVLSDGPDVVTLDFVSGLEHLEDLGIWAARRGTVESVESLVRLHRLRVLKLIGAARRAKDIERLGSLPSLEVLFIEGARGVKSLNFLRNARHLRELALIHVPIEDGDFEVLLTLPALERVHDIRPHRKHYSHTTEQLNEALAVRRRRP